MPRALSWRWGRGLSRGQALLCSEAGTHRSTGGQLGQSARRFLDGTYYFRSSAAMTPGTELQQLLYLWPLPPKL